jgi:hypothetical protein
MQIFTFEIINSESITDAIFGQKSFSKTALIPLSNKLLMNSYKTSNIIYNMGSTFYYIIILLTITLHALICTATNKGCFRSLLISKLTDYIWNILPSLHIRIFIQINYDFLIKSYIQLNVTRLTQTWADNISVALAVASVIISFVIPVFFALILRKISST